MPLPSGVSAPSYTGLQETLQVHLQAIRFGDVGITVCPCEQFADQSREIKSRLDLVPDNNHVGFDYTDTPGWCSQNAGYELDAAGTRRTRPPTSRRSATTSTRA